MLGILNGGGGKLVGNVYAYYIRANIRENCIYCTFHIALFLVHKTFTAHFFIS